jgi:hypothetical protein
VIVPAFNQIALKASHNSFEAAESLFDQLLYHRIRHLDIDINPTRSWGKTPGADAGDWFVYHNGASSFSRCATLKTCLATVFAFHRTFPRHEVITLTLESVDPFDSAGHSAIALDRTLITAFGEAALYRPRDLLGRCAGATTLRDAVTTCGWPSVDDLRGKIVVLIMNRDDYDTVSRGPTDPPKVGFLLRTKTGRPPQLAQTNILFYGAEDADTPTDPCPPRPAYGPTLYSDGLISRIEHYDCATARYGANDPGAFELFYQNQTQILSTNAVNDHAGVSTHNAYGYPFRCVAGIPRTTCNLDAAVEDLGQPIEVSVASEGFGDRADSLALVYDDFAGREGAIWTAAIGVSSWGVDLGAAGCLTARASLAPDSPHFSVCKSADERGIFLRLRAEGCTGPCGSVEGTSDLLAKDPDRLPEEAAYVMLTMVSTPSGWMVKGYGSFRGDGGWSELSVNGQSSWIFPKPLGLQGLTATSNGTGNRNTDGSLYRFVFGDVRRNGVPAIAATVASGSVQLLSHVDSVGTVSQRSVVVSGRRVLTTMVEQQPTR